MVSTAASVPAFSSEAWRAFPCGVCIFSLCMCGCSGFPRQSSKTRTRSIPIQCPRPNALIKMWIWYPGAAQRPPTTSLKRMAQMQGKNFNVHHVYVINKVCSRILFYENIPESSAALWQTYGDNLSISMFLIENTGVFYRVNKEQWAKGNNKQKLLMPYTGSAFFIHVHNF